MKGDGIEGKGSDLPQESAPSGARSGGTGKNPRRTGRPDPSSRITTEGISRLLATCPFFRASSRRFAVACSVRSAKDSSAIVISASGAEGSRPVPLPDSSKRIREIGREKVERKPQENQPQTDRQWESCVIRILTCGTALARIPRAIWVKKRTAITGADNLMAITNIFPEEIREVR